MNPLRRFWARLQVLLDRDRFDRELAEEMRFHLELKEADYIASGMSESEARDAARRKFGNTTRHREESRGVMSFAWLEAAAQDARYALRSLARDKAFGIVAILSLALGIGATTAIFTLVNVTLIRPLPFEAPDRIVFAYQYVTPGPMTQSDTMPWPYVKFEQLRTLVPAFEETGFFAWDDMHLSGDGAAERLKIEAASSGYFSVLGVRPAIGRVFTAADDAPAGTPAIALLSHGLWQRRFGGDPAIVGRTISLKGVSLTVVGVLPAGFSGLTGAVEAWIPMQALPLYGRREAERLTSPMAVSGRVIARVRPGITQALLDRQMSAAAARLSTEFPMGMGRLTSSRWGAGALPLAEARRHPLLEPMLRILSVAVAVVLLIVCANLASLMLARARSRQGELGIRVALGAGRGRLVRQMLTESLLLASIGGALGTVLAYWGATLLSTLRPDLPSYYLLLRDTDLLEAARLAPDWRVLTFALAVTIVVGLLFGVAPALAASRADVAEALKSGVQRTGQARVRGRGVLVVAEMAMATMLLIGAGLMLRSFRQLLRADTGFDSGGVVTMSLEPTDSASATWPRRMSVLAAITGTPGVRAAALQSCIPLDEGCRLGPVTRIDERNVEVGTLPPIELHVTTPGYFQTMRIPLVAGRLLGERDVGGDSTNAMLVNESAARLLWPDRSAVGRRLNVGSVDDTVGVEVVGVVKDVRYGRIDEPAMPAVYYAAAQSRLTGGTNLFVRVDGRAAGAIPRLRRVVRTADPAVVAHDARTMDQIVRRASSSTRFVTTLLVLFAIVAGLLAALGVYGVLAYSVTQRTREFGVRMALGAQPSAVRRLVTRQGAWLTLAGLGVGCVGAYLASGLLQSFLYGVAGTDAATFVSAVVLLALVGALAAFLPARRATAVDPIVALRAE